MLLRRFMQHVKEQNWFAVGLDVIVVIVGIFLGFQVQEWHEESKDAQIEIDTLIEINANLTVDLQEIRRDIEIMNEVESKSKFIITYLNANDKPSNELFNAVSRLRVIPHFDETRSGYDFLKDKGLDLVKNPQIRNELSALYERFYSYYGIYERERVDFHRVNTMPKLIQYFYMPLDYSARDSSVLLEFAFTIKENDYVKLREDEDFIRLVHAVIFENAAVIVRAKRMETMILKLIALIDDELSRRA